VAILNGSVNGIDDYGQARSADRKPSVIPRPMARPAERKPAGTRRNGLARIKAAADRHVRHPSRCSRGEPGISGNRHNPGVQAWASSQSDDVSVPAGDEQQSTRIRGHLRTELVPWDDPDFVREYEGAHEQVVREGLLINGPRAAARLEELMRAAGYPRVSVKVERTIDEALRHAARWTVRRDGAEARGRE
jgi:hypothetical protein